MVVYSLVRNKLIIFTVKYNALIKVIDQWPTTHPTYDISSWASEVSIPIRVIFDYFQMEMFFMSEFGLMVIVIGLVELVLVMRVR